MLNYSLPPLKQLPSTMPHDGSVTIVLEEGIPIFRASKAVQKRIMSLLEKQKEDGLTAEEIRDLDRYEEIDDYLSHLNRLIRNQLHASTP